MEALETKHAQLISTMEYDLLFIVYPNDADDTWYRQIQLALLPGPKGQATSQSQQIWTFEFTRPGEAPPAEKIGLGATKNPMKHDGAEGSSSKTGPW